MADAAQEPAEPADAAQRTNIVRLSVAGIAVEVDLLTITGPEWRDLKHATGLHQVQLVEDATKWEDFDAQAALVWLAVRQERPEISYDDVLSLFSYNATQE